ncbi:MAG: CDP-archaeol synthase [Hyphomicrobiales bacterium]|nr:CDP-archaeol synthase [Hyphomicrobiales bacterium]
MIALAVGALVAGGMPFTLFWLSAALAIHFEWQSLVAEKNGRARLLAGGAGIAIAAAFAAQLGYDIALVLTGIAALATGALAERGRKLWAGAGVFYAAALIIAICALRPPIHEMIDTPFALRAIIWLFAVVWGTDIAAYFVGRIVGGPKVWPALSAGKTWSGTLGGIAVGAALGVAVVAIDPVVAVRFAPVFLLGLVCSAGSQMGDFFESAVKRHFGVKDSSNLIPGHGGFMDRLDGFVAAAVLAAILGYARYPLRPSEGLLLWP